MRSERQRLPMLGERYAKYNSPGINRVRRRAYALSCDWRRRQAGAKLAEPPNTEEIS